MLRRDWSKRPAAEAYEDLVLDQWWTKWKGVVDADAGASLRAFYGRHEVTAQAGGKTATATVILTPGEAGVVELRLK